MNCVKMKKKLIEDLKYLERSVKYCMLRNYIADQDFGDIDILASSKDKNKLINIMQRLGYETFQVYTTTIFYHKLIGPELVRIHVHFDYFYDFIHVNEAVGRVYRYKGIPVLPDSDYAASLIFKIRWGRPKEKYLANLRKIWEKIDNKALIQSLSNAFKPESIDLDILKKEKFSKLDFKKNMLWRKRLRDYSNLPGILAVSLRQLVKPGRFIVFLGVDGSGKTTTANSVAKYLKNRKFRVAVVYGGRYKFQFLPINCLVGSIAKKKKQEGYQRDVIRYHSNFVFNVVPFVYYLEYLLRYIFIIFPKRKLNNFVISDRFYSDVIISPNSNTKIARFLYKLMPRPEIIYVYNSANVLHKRRPGHPKEDILRQLKEFEKNKDLLDHRIKTINKQDTLHKVLKILFNGN